MKIRFLTLLCLLSMPFWLSSQTFSGAGAAIPDNPTVTSVVTAAVASTPLTNTCADAPSPTIDVPGILGYNYQITNVTITNIQHTWASDLDKFLIAPDGTSIELSTDNGGNTGLDVATNMVFNFNAGDPCATTWTSSASTTQPGNGMSPENGGTCPAFAPQFNFTCSINSATISGMPVDGNWTLSIDDDAGGGTGSFGSWSITFAALAPPATDSNGTAIDVAECCVAPCSLVGQTVVNEGLEPGECNEIIFFSDPTLAGEGCEICPDPMGVLPGAVTTQTGNSNYSENLDANGFLVDFTLGAGTGTSGTVNYQIVAPMNGSLTFDFVYTNAEAAFWDPFMITGPNGTIADISDFATTTSTGSGTYCEAALAGDAFNFNLRTLDGFGGGEAKATVQNLAFVQDFSGACYVLTQTGGPTSGDILDPGTYTVTWEAVPNTVADCVYTPDPNGEVLTFETEINVLPYSGPVQTALTCNDLVNLSLDENCEVSINADLFLEGGPYGCYETRYAVMIDGGPDVNGQTITLPLGNHAVKVVDNETGNSCWGNLFVEDKLIPQIACSDFAVTCIDDIPAAPVVTDVSTLVLAEGVTNSGTTTYTGVMPNAGVVTDVNIVIDIAFGGFDEMITITSPSGTSVLVWPQSLSGCPTLNVIGDDEGVVRTTGACVDFNDGANVNLELSFAGFGFPGFAQLQNFEGEPIGGTWTLTMGGNGTINNISLIFNNGLGLLVSDALPTDPCGNSTLTYNDVVTNVGCAGGVNKIITRTWVLKDATGNSSSCTQTITVYNIEASALTYPPLLVELPCNAGTSPAEIASYYDDPSTKDNVNTSIVENNEGYPYAYPTYMQGGHPQKVDTEVCKLIASYTDQNFAACGGVCGGNKKVVRTWTILNWCTLDLKQHAQVIKAVDSEGPTYTAMDFEVSTDPWGCAATVKVPHPWELHDNCDANPTYYVQGPLGSTALCPGCPGNSSDQWLLLNVPKEGSPHTVSYYATDCCGNVTKKDVVLTVVDKTPPVAIAFQNLVVSLTSSGTGNDGFAKIYNYQISNGSYDGCGPVHLEIRRDSDNCGIKGNATYNADGHPQDGSSNPTSANYDPDNGEYVKFCCADLTEIDPVTNVRYGLVTVWLRVWDDGDMDGKYGSSGDNYNETWCTVRVEDKLPPAIVCPPDVVLTCDMDYTDLSMTGEATAYGTCSGIEVEYEDIVVNLDACGSGFVQRRWRVKGSTGIFCTQRIDLTPLTPFDGKVNWPKDKEVNGCPNNVDSGVPTWTAGPCDIIGYSVETDTFKFEDGACFKLVNHWTVIDWCQYTPNAAGWAGEGYYTHTQIIKVFDDTKPVLSDCEDKMFGVDANCEHVLTLTNSAHDDGSANCPTGWLKWQVFVDLWADGTNDYEFSSFLPSSDTNPTNDTNGNGINDMYVKPTANDGEVSVTIPEVISGSMSNHKVVWKVTDGCGNVTSCTYNVMVVDKKDPTPYCVDISSAVMENGQVELWASDFNKNSFDNCTAQEDLWYTFEEMHPVINDTIISNKLVNINVPHYFKGQGVFVDFYPATKATTKTSYEAGDIQLWKPELQSSAMIFNCDDLPVAEVHMTVWDEKLNSDFCVVYLSLVDNQHACNPPGGSRIAGTVANEGAVGLSGATVYLDANSIEYPKVESTDNGGEYAFESNTHGMDYAVSASHDVDYRNGVSTLDLVLIQRHILGIAQLNSPYKVIAADANNDSKVSVSDLSQLRKLILGLYENDNLPDNESWRFVDSQESLDLANPFPFTEVIYLNNLSQDEMANNFVAVKIGDVNGSVDMPNARANGSEVRSSRTVNFNSTDRAVKAGETVLMSVTSNDFADVYGYQFTMQLNGLNYTGIQSGALNINESNVGALSNGVLTMSWNSDKSVSIEGETELFVMSFIATRDGQLSEMMSMSSSVTPAEVYVGENLSVGKVELNLSGVSIEGGAYSLNQNEPNPFLGSTTISYSLPVASEVTMSIMDVTGRVVYENTVTGERGMNTMTIDEKSLNGAGLYYYQMRSGDYTATKKMIVIE